LSANIEKGVAMTTERNSVRPRLAGKIAVVTGAGSGIGQACARLFAQEGARVIGCDLDAAALHATVESIAGMGCARPAAKVLNLTREAEVQQLFKEVDEEFGGVDILVNAAAFCVMKWIEDLSLEDWRKTLTGELDLVFLACRAAWPLMKRRGGGSIVNFSSANSHMSLRGSPALAHCAGKGGVLAMTHQLAMEGAPFRIRANSIAPGLIRTAATAWFLEIPGMAEVGANVSMLGRIGEPEEIAWAAVFLASDEASFVTAAELRVDGGATHC
jgi:NAD(P)-dependent dehydrogenase (short-subunit alcohol dehydrogenase family)